MDNVRGDTRTGVNTISDCVAAPITVQSELGQAIQGEEPRAPAAAPDLSVTPNWEPPTTTAAAAPMSTPTAAARTDAKTAKTKAAPRGKAPRRIARRNNYDDDC